MHDEPAEVTRHDVRRLQSSRDVQYMTWINNALMLISVNRGDSSWTKIYTELPNKNEQYSYICLCRSTVICNADVEM